MTRGKFKTYYHKTATGYRWQIATSGGTLLKSGTAINTSKARQAVKKAREQLLAV